MQRKILLHFFVRFFFSNIICFCKQGVPGDIFFGVEEEGPVWKRQEKGTNGTSGMNGWIWWRAIAVGSPSHLKNRMRLLYLVVCSTRPTVWESVIYSSILNFLKSKKNLKREAVSVGQAIVCIYLSIRESLRQILGINTENCHGFER